MFDLYTTHKTSPLLPFFNFISEQNKQKVSKRDIVMQIGIEYNQLTFRRRNARKCRDTLGGGCDGSCETLMLGRLLRMLRHAVSPIRRYSSTAVWLVFFQSVFTDWACNILVPYRCVWRNLLTASG